MTASIFWGWLKTIVSNVNPHFLLGCVTDLKCCDLEILTGVSPLEIGHFDSFGHVRREASHSKKGKVAFLHLWSRTWWKRLSSSCLCVLGYRFVTWLWDHTIGVLEQTSKTSVVYSLHFLKPWRWRFNEDEDKAPSSKMEKCAINEECEDRSKFGLERQIIWLWEFGIVFLQPWGCYGLHSSLWRPHY